MGIYDPVSIDNNGEKIAVSMLNRTYSFTKESVMPSSIISSGKEMLAGPIDFYIETNREKRKCSDIFVCDMEEKSEELVQVAGAAAADKLIINAMHNIEFDGCDIIDLTLCVRGRSVAETLMGEKEDTGEIFHLNKLYLDVPLKKEYIKYFQVFGCGKDNGTMFGKKKYIPNDSLHISSEIPEGGMIFGFKEQVYLCGNEVGIGFFFRDDEKWNYDDKNLASEIIEQEDRYILRFHFFDNEPKSWRQKGDNEEKVLDLRPISLRFGMMVTPIKNPPKPMDFERNLHFDCFKRIPNNHDEYLSAPIPGSGSDEICFDRLKRLGVKVLYIHEKWNDIQNSTMLTSAAAKRLRFIIDECHKRDIKVVPYFGYEISTLSPLYEKVGSKYMKIRKEGIRFDWFWYRTPEQRAVFVCMGSDWREIFLEGLKELIEKYDFDGFYFDGTAWPVTCCNSEHGCGYTDEFGNLHDTHPVFEIRDFAKKLYRFASERGKTVQFHLSGCHNLAAIGFCDSIWDGEVFQRPLLLGELKEMPEEMLRAQFDSSNIGVPMQALCYSNPPVWTFDNAIGMMLLHNCMPKSNDIEEPLEIMSEIWDIYDEFNDGAVDWRPYYNASGRVTCETEDIRISCYERENKILAIVATTRADFEGEAEIKAELPKIYDAREKTMLSKSGEAKVKLHGFDFKLLVFEK